MSGVKKFEELECWKEARTLVKMVYELTLNPEFRKDFGLKDQIQRTSVSVMTNIAEGFARFSIKEFIRFLDYTQSSSEEVKSLLYVAFDLGYIDKQELEKTYQKASDVRNMTLSLIKYLRKSERAQ
ncbi:four helix bundle protein [Fodinibius salinus]|uniref:Four helix bundle protein n=1 Tax=Fodinibius salinus TaxID=860790 RepID=A0A5D3YIC5_9BACT|nr:four helix bundle protein [Fodinibius salinus]TYP93332.1 four helix bundle protein [Fodinibius salinus]